MYCWKCGAEIKEGTIFCSSCGNRITPIKDTQKENMDRSNRPEDIPIGHFLPEFCLYFAWQAQSVADASGSADYAYDSHGRVIQIRYSGGFTKEYAHDKADRVISLTVKQGSVTELSLVYEYDKVGRLTAVINDGVRSIYIYNLAGQLVSETNGRTGIVSDYQYTPSSALKSLITYRCGEIVNSYEYEYDLRGNQTKKIENGEETWYFYDALSWLTIAVMPGDLVQNYEYDDYGNIVRFAPPCPPRRRNQRGGQEHLAHDPKGKLPKRTGADEGGA